MRRSLTTLMLLALAAPAAAAGYPFERYLNIRAASAPAVAPDGSRVAFLTNITGTNQVWMVKAAGGWPEQITFFSDRVQAVAWSPDGAWLLVGKDAGGNERTQLWLFSPDGARQERITHDDSKIYRSARWSHDGRRIAYASNERAEAHFDIYVMDIATRKPVRVMQQDGSNNVAAWAPDDSALIVSRGLAGSDNTLLLVRLDTQQATELTPHTEPALYTSVNWPPGQILYLASDQGRDFVNLAAIDLTAPKLVFLEDRPHDVESLLFSEDGRRVVVSANEGGASRLSLREGGLSGKELAAPRPGDGVIGGLEFSRDGSKLAYTFSGAKNPGDVFLHDLAAGTSARLTTSSLGGIPADAFVEPKLVSYPTFDGLKIPALMYKPPANSAGRQPPAGSAGRPPAAVMIVHGGPEGQTRPAFSAVNQFFVSQGYVVLAPNIRGSTGYGRAYQQKDDVRRRLDSIKDLAAGAEYLKTSGAADPARIAVMGGSYGGYATLACLTFHPELWAAGVDIVGISNFRSFLKNTSVWRTALRASEYGDPVADAEFLDSVSPLNHIEKIRAPLIVIQGANDPRVPQSEADQMVEKLRARQVPVEYLLFPDEGHGVVKLPNRIKAYTAIADFLAKHLQ